MVLPHPPPECRPGVLAPELRALKPWDRPESNQPPWHYECRALPLSYDPAGANLPRPGLAPGLAAPSAQCLCCWASAAMIERSRRGDSHPRVAVYRTAAVAAEPRRQNGENGGGRWCRPTSRPDCRDRPLSKRRPAPRGSASSNGETLPGRRAPLERRAGVRDFSPCRDHGYRAPPSPRPTGAACGGCGSCPHGPRAHR